MNNEAKEQDIIRGQEFVDQSVQIMLEAAEVMRPIAVTFGTEDRLAQTKELTLRFGEFTKELVREGYAPDMLLGLANGFYDSLIRLQKRAHEDKAERQVKL